MVVLRSEPGCQSQLPHTDYPEQMADGSAWYDWRSNDVPLGCVLALQDETHFDVWPGAFILMHGGCTSTGR